jgi:hypothetical protein
MIKNTINAAIILICFSVFGHAYANIPTEINKDIFNSQNKVEDNVIANLKSENTIWADTTEVKQKGKAKKKTYKAWVTLINQKDKVKGFLYAVNDSSIVVSSSSELLADEYSASLNNTIAVANIKKIRLRKKGNVGKGYIIGTSIGIVTGILLAAGEEDGFTTLAAAGMLGIVGSVVGTGVGSISGTKRYTIDGNQETFLISQQELKTLSLVGE